MVTRFWIPILAIVLVPASSDAKPWRGVMAPGELSSKHVSAEDNCERCHLAFKGVPNEKCLTCHDALATRTRQGKGFHASLAKRACIECHTDHRGAKGSMTKPAARSAFDHATTGFALEGPHGRAKCDACHQKPIGEMSSRCGACHSDPHEGSLGSACQSCHASSEWKKGLKSLADHDLSMEGGHAQRTCGDCHTGGRHLDAVVACSDCHETAHGGTRAACDVCHTVTGFTPAKFDHHVCTCVFPGKHQTFDCLSCHPKWRFTDTPTLCSGCHASIQKHEPLGECSSCHSALSWKKRDRFDHNKRSTFKLVDRHLEADCTQCHTVAGRFRGAPSACEACHAKAGAQAHGDFGPCASCHTTADFKTSTFDHASTGFALTGRHEKLACLDCHAEKTKDFPSRSKPSGRLIDGARPTHDGRAGALALSVRASRPRNYRHLGTLAIEPGETCMFTPPARLPGLVSGATEPGEVSKHPAVPSPERRERACAHCHADPHEGAVGHACESCHTTEAWAPSTFDGSRHEVTRFPLRGRHKETACTLCHVAGQLKSLPMACGDCHLDPHRRKLGDECGRCHTEDGFAPVPLFDHLLTGFALEGPHARERCERCHEGSRGDAIATAREPMACRTCHELGHGVELGADCRRCHTLREETRGPPVTFASARGMPFFEHNATGFPLDRRHRAQACGACHPADGPPPAARCAGCHLDPHSGQLGQACEECHKADRFRLARFDHDRAGWPLRGRHFLTPCASCHTNQRWVGLTSECFDCHALDAARAKARVGIHPFGPLDCRDCHFSFWRW